MRKSYTITFISASLLAKTKRAVKVAIEEGEATALQLIQTKEAR